MACGRLSCKVPTHQPEGRRGVPWLRTLQGPFILAQPSYSPAQKAIKHHQVFLVSVKFQNKDTPDKNISMFTIFKSISALCNFSIDPGLGRRKKLNLVPWGHWFHCRLPAKPQIKTPALVWVLFCVGAFGAKEAPPCRL